MVNTINVNTDRSKWMMKFAAIMAVFTLIMLLFPQYAFAEESTAAASGAAIVTQSFKTLQEIVTAIVSSIGSIILLWGFFEWGTSLQSQEGVMQASAFKRIGGGLVMVIAPQLVMAFVG